MDSKPLIFSGSFWAIASMLVTGVEWDKLILSLESLITGSVPSEWGPVVHAAVMLILAILGAMKVITRSTTIDGIVMKKK